MRLDYRTAQVKKWIYIFILCKSRTIFFLPNRQVYLFDKRERIKEKVDLKRLESAENLTEPRDSFSPSSRYQKLKVFFFFETRPNTVW